jgi:hypothetical protein
VKGQLRILARKGGNMVHYEKGRETIRVGRVWRECVAQPKEGTIFVCLQRVTIIFSYKESSYLFITLNVTERY